MRKFVLGVVLLGFAVSGLLPTHAIDVVPSSSDIRFNKTDSKRSVTVSLSDDISKLTGKSGFIKAKLKYDKKLFDVNAPKGKVLIPYVDGEVRDSATITFTLKDPEAITAARTSNYSIKLPRKLRKKYGIDNYSGTLNVDVGGIKVSGQVKNVGASTSSIKGLARVLNPLNTVGGTEVNLREVNSDGSLGAVVDETTTDADGNFTVELPEGEEIGTNYAVEVPSQDLHTFTSGSEIVVDPIATAVFETITSIVGTDDAIVSLANIIADEVSAMYRQMVEFNPELEGSTDEVVAHIRTTFAQILTNMINVSNDEDHDLADADDDEDFDRDPEDFEEVDLEDETEHGLATNDFAGDEYFVIFSELTMGGTTAAASFQQQRLSAELELGEALVSKPSAAGVLDIVPLPGQGYEASLMKFEQHDFGPGPGDDFFEGGPNDGDSGADFDFGDDGLTDLTPFNTDDDTSSDNGDGNTDDSSSDGNTDDGSSDGNTDDGSSDDNSDDSANNDDQDSSPGIISCDPNSELYTPDLCPSGEPPVCVVDAIEFNQFECDTLRGDFDDDGGNDDFDDGNHDDDNFDDGGHHEDDFGGGDDFHRGPSCFELEASSEIFDDAGHHDDDDFELYATVDSNNVITVVEPASEDTWNDQGESFVFRDSDEVFTFYPITDGIHLASTFAGGEGFKASTNEKIEEDKILGFATIVKKSNFSVSDMDGTYGMVSFGIDLGGHGRIGLMGMDGTIAVSNSLANFNFTQSEIAIEPNEETEDCCDFTFENEPGGSESGVAQLSIQDHLINISVGDEEIAEIFRGYPSPSGDVLVFVSASDRNPRGDMVFPGDRRRRKRIDSAGREYSMAVRLGSGMSTATVSGKSYRLLSYSAAINTTGGVTLTNHETGTLSFSGATASFTGLTENKAIRDKCDSALTASTAAVADATATATIADDGAITMTYNGIELRGYVSADGDLIVMRASTGSSMGLYIAVPQ